MYGFDGKETENLRARFRKLNGDSTWSCLDDFLIWAKESGYKTGMHLRKHVETLPHGPTNSCWSTLNMLDTKKRYLDNMRNSCEFCKDCQKECPTTGYGCKEWADNWKKNWNENIYVPPVKPVVEEGPMVFRYEHPDLVREGIVFEGSRSV